MRRRIFLVSAHRDDSDCDRSEFVYPVCFFREKADADDFVKQANAVATEIEPPSGGRTTRIHPLDPAWSPGRDGRSTRYVVDEVRSGRRPKAAS